MFNLWQFDAVTGKDLGPLAAERPVAMLPAANRGTLIATATSRDGKTLAAAWNKLIDIWDLTTGPGSTVSGRLRATLRLPSNVTVRHLAFRADGKVAAMSDDGNNVYLFDAHTGQQRATLKFGVGLSGALEFSPDCKWLAVGTGKEIKLFDADTGADKHVLNGHRTPVSSLTFRDDNGVLLSLTTDGEVKLWDLVAGKELLTIPGSPTALAIQGLEPDGKTVVTRELKVNVGAASSNVIRRWNLATGRKVGQPVATPNGGFFSPDQSIRFAIEFDASFRLLDTDTSTERFRLPLDSKIDDPQIVFSADGTRVAIVAMESGASNGNTKRTRPAAEPRLVQVWDLGDAKLLASYRGIVEDDHVRRSSWQNRSPLVVFSPDNRFVAMAVRNAAQAGSSEVYIGDVRVVDLSTGEVKSVVKAPHITSLAFSTDGKILATGDNTIVHLWDTASGEELRSVAKSPGHYVHVVGFAMEDSILLVCLHTPRIVFPEKQEESFELVLWDLASDKLRTSLKGARMPTAISPNGRCVAAVGSESTNWSGHVIQIWDAFTGQQRAVLRGHRSQVNNLWFTPDGEALLTQGWDGMLRWRTAFPDPAEHQYLQGTALLWKLVPKLQAFQSNDKPQEALLPAAKRFVKTLEIKSDHQGAYAGLARVVEFLEKVPGGDQGRIRSELLVLLRKVARTCHDRAEAHIVLGAGLEAESDAAALEEYRRAVNCDVTHADAHARIAATLLRMGKEEEALAAYRQTLKVKSDHVEANRRAAELLFQNDDTAGAAPLLAKRQEVKPDGAGYYSLAQCLERLEQFDEAIPAYENAATFAAPKALRDLAHLLQRLGRWSDASAVHKRRVAAAPGDTRIQSDLAYAFRRNGQMAEARAAYSRAGQNSVLPAFGAGGRNLRRNYSAKPNGKVDSANGEELLVLANFCLFKLRAPTAARLYSDAIEATPKLVSERYNAACAAALAGTNADTEAAALDEKEKACWRRQALDWLRQKLEQHRKTLASGPVERPWQIQETLAYWRRDPDLVGVLNPGGGNPLGGRRTKILGQVLGRRR